ncbi:6499_t:CDS:1, partial [Racocetra persica]
SSETIVNCWKKTGIFIPQEEEIQKIEYEYNYNNSEDIISKEKKDLDVLLAQLLENNYLNAYEYINIEDAEFTSELIDKDILKAINDTNKKETEPANSETKKKISYTEAEKAINTTLRFLYEQDIDFHDVEKDIKTLRKLHQK